MLKIKNYVKVKSLEEAYELNQKKTSLVLGGMVWLKMTNRNVVNAIDLSGLGLDTIEETEEEFSIGCMTTLHALEIHEGMNRYTHGAIRESLRHIVGVQMRNCATVGGSIFGRYGFSDVLTMFLGMDSYVEMYHAGIIPMKEFAAMKKERDILVRILVKKKPLSCVYTSFRNTQTDFPVLTVCASCVDGESRTVIGAAPYRAVILEDPEGICTNMAEKDNEELTLQIRAWSDYVREHVKTGSNLRASAEYRKILAGVYTKRAWTALAAQMKGETDEG